MPQISGWQLRPCLPILTAAGTTLLLFSCGGGGSTSPTPAATPTPVPMVSYDIQSAETGQPASATLTAVGSREGTLTGTSLTFSGVTLNAQVTATTPSGFLSPREGVVDALGRHDVFLWPDNQNVPGRLTQELLYTRDGQGDRPLIRITDRIAYAVLDPSLRSDRNRNALSNFTAMVTAANGWTQLVETTDPPAGAVIITIQLDSSLRGTASGTARTSTRADGSISGATINLAEEEYLRWPAILLHELGHAFGLNHLVSFKGMMDPSDFKIDDFRDTEKAVLRMMQYRKPGNRWPDSARSSAGSLAAHEQLACLRLPAPR